MRRAYLDRARYLGDPDFVAGARSSGSRARTYAARAARRTIDPSEGDAIGAGGGREDAREATQTTHYSVVDANGMAV